MRAATPRSGSPSSAGGCLAGLSALAALSDFGAGAAAAVAGSRSPAQAPRARAQGRSSSRSAPSRSRPSGRRCPTPCRHRAWAAPCGRRRVGSRRRSRASSRSPSPDRPGTARTSRRPARHWGRGPRRCVSSSGLVRHPRCRSYRPAGPVRPGPGASHRRPRRRSRRASHGVVRRRGRRPPPSPRHTPARGRPGPTPRGRRGNTPVRRSKPCLYTGEATLGTPTASPTMPRDITCAPENGHRLPRANTVGAASSATSRKIATWRPPTRAAAPARRQVVETAHPFPPRVRTRRAPTRPRPRSGRRRCRSSVRSRRLVVQLGPGRGTHDRQAARP